MTGLEGPDGQAVSADVDAGTGRELVPVEEPVAHSSTGSADRALQRDIITDGDLLAFGMLCKSQYNPCVVNGNL